jgi:spore coat protein CotH
VSKYNTCVTIKDTVADDEKEADIVKAAMDSFMESYNRFEEAVRTRNYESVSQIIDVESFIKYYLISELTNNPDAYDSSYYLYKDGTDDKIHAGPVWDFDLALGNRTWMYGDNPRAYSPYLFVSQSNAMQKATNTLEFFELLEIPEFQNKVKVFFKEHLLDKETELINYVKTRAQSIQDEAERDADKWGFSSPSDEVDYLLDWLKRKIEVVNYNLNR